MKINYIIPSFKFIKLLKNNYRYYYVIFLEIVNTFIIMQQNVGIYYEKFFIMLLLCQ